MDNKEIEKKYKPLKRNVTVDTKQLFTTQTKEKKQAAK